MERGIDERMRALHMANTDRLREIDRLLRGRDTLGY